MKEIGGYIEIDRYTLPMLHEGAIAVNCGINALAYLIEARNIKKIVMPKYLCHSMPDVCLRHGVLVRSCSVGSDFRYGEDELEEDEWLLLVNYYGQIDNATIQKLSEQYHHVIVDNTQAYFQTPVAGVDTFYSCRKFLGVPDGAFLYTEARLARSLTRDESFEHMHFLLGRFERIASEFYSEYTANNARFAKEPIKQMSKLTENLLHGIDYEQIKHRRTENFIYLHRALADRNKLRLIVPDGPFMYPFWTENGVALRKELQKRKIYIPTLWPNVLETCAPDTVEYDMAANILPLPCDQRYGMEEMEAMLCAIDDLSEKEGKH